MNRHHDEDSALDALLLYAVVCLLPRPELVEGVVAGLGAWWVG